MGPCSPQREVLNKRGRTTIEAFDELSIFVLFQSCERASLFAAQARAIICGAGGARDRRRPIRHCQRRQQRCGPGDRYVDFCSQFRFVCVCVCVCVEFDCLLSCLLSKLTFDSIAALVDNDAVRRTYQLLVPCRCEIANHSIYLSNLTYLTDFSNQLLNSQQFALAIPSAHSKSHVWRLSQMKSIVFFCCCTFVEFFFWHTKLGHCTTYTRVCVFQSI